MRIRIKNKADEQSALFLYIFSTSAVVGIFTSNHNPALLEIQF